MLNNHYARHYKAIHEFGVGGPCVALTCVEGCVGKATEQKLSQPDGC